MLSTERSLEKGDGQGETYQKQIEDMLERGVVKEASDREMELYQGHVNFLPHIAAINP